jgi:hypothetical protein
MSAIPAAAAASVQVLARLLERNLPVPICSSGDVAVVPAPGPGRFLPRARTRCQLG